MGDLILFPWKASHKIPQPKTIDEVIEQANFVKEFHINESMIDIIDSLFEDLRMRGFIFDNTDSKDAAFMVESIKSVLMRNKGLYHPFHEYIDKVVEIDEDNDFVIDLSVKITKKRKKKKEQEKIAQE